MQQVVAVDDDVVDQLEVGVRSRAVGAGRVRGYHQPVLLIVDLDGVVYRGLTPVPGVPEVLARRAAAGDIIIYATNNSRWHRSDYEARLVSMGAPVQPDRIVTAARATALGARGTAGTAPSRHGLRWPGPRTRAARRRPSHGRTDRPRPCHGAGRGRRRHRPRPHDGPPVDRRRRHPRRSAVRRHEPRSGLPDPWPAARRRGRDRRCPRDGIGPRARPRRRQAGARPVPPGGAGGGRDPGSTRSSSATACARTSWPRTVSAPDPC